jgi:hypothetical protein
MIFFRSFDNHPTMRKAYLTALVVSGIFVSTTAFVPQINKPEKFTELFVKNLSKTPVSISKPTGTSFLPEETVERAKSGSPIEKDKIAKDPVNAWVDVYEYARKIREGEMTWEDVEKADLDTVRSVLGLSVLCLYCISH